MKLQCNSVFSIKYRYSDILIKKQQQHKLHLSRLFCCNHNCYCSNMVSVTPASRYITSASRYRPRYQSRSSMYIRGLIPRNFAESADAVPIDVKCLKHEQPSVFGQQNNQPSFPYTLRVVWLIKTNHSMLLKRIPWSTSSKLSLQTRNINVFKRIFKLW